MVDLMSPDPNFIKNVKTRGYGEYSFWCMDTARKEVWELLRYSSLGLRVLQLKLSRENLMSSRNLRGYHQQTYVRKSGNSDALRHVETPSNL